MVERTESNVTEFIGQVVSVDKQPSSLDENRECFHIQIDAKDIEVKGVTGYMHEYFNIPATATEESVPDGSVLDKFLTELEVLDKKLKKVDKVSDALKWLEGKTFKFVKKKLGRAYDGHEAREYWTPIQIVEEK